VGLHAKPDDASNLIIKGGLYPRPRTSTITATVGDKPRPYFDSQVFIEVAYRRN